jgi:predicted dehydrogenase
MKKYSAVVVGCGKVGATFEMDTGLIKPASHAAALAAHPEVELVALVDPDAGLRARAGEYYQVATYADVETCLSEIKPDIMVIATPPPTHEALLARALTYGTKAIVCEKPVADSLAAAARMIEAVEKGSALVIVNHQRRFFPLFEEARAKIAAGELGRIQHITAYYSNGLLNNGTHTLDAITFLTGDTATWAIGVANEKNTAAPFGRNIDGMVGYESGMIATLQSLDNDSFGIHDFRIYGTTGVLTIGQYGYAFAYTPVRESVTFSGVKEPKWDEATTVLDVRSMLAGTIEHVVACLKGTELPRSTLTDGYRTMQVLAALERSADEDGTRITIS